MSMPLPISAPVTNPGSNGARLVAADGRELPLRSVTLEGDATGGLASTIVRQVFHNPHSTPLAVTYQLPLPPDGAVVDFAFTLGERTIRGRVETKADARAVFEQALVEGRTAALLEQDRSSLFHQELGNVPAGAEIVCEITVEHLLTWRSGGWEWRFPTVVAPRFLGSPGQTPDAPRIAVDVLDGPAPVRCALTLRIGDAISGTVSSPSHVIAPESGRWSLGENAPLDRDVVVRWPVASTTVGASVEVTRSEDGAHAMLTLVPPKPAHQSAPVARDLILLLDISGSMGGRPLEQLKAFSRALIKTLRPDDQLELIAFSSRQSRWQGGATSMTPRNQAQALTWLEALRAGGGTHMHEAIIEALSPIRADAQRQVVLVSDGLIGFETQVIGAIRNRLPAGSRVHTIGVGSGVNRSLTGPCARAGAGLEVVVGLDEPVEPAVADLLARTDAPLVVDLGLRGRVLREVAPMRVPDLFAGCPTRLFLAIDPQGGPLEITGRTAEGPYSLTVTVPSAGAGRRVLATRFARERVEDLELEIAAGADGSEVDPRIEALGLQHQIATRLTSWVAATEEATVDPGEPTVKTQVPQQLPYGMSAEGAGLRSAQPQVFAMASHMMAPPPAPQAAPASAPRVRSKRAVRRESPKGGGVLRKLGEALFGGPPAEAEADEEAFAVEEAAPAMPQRTAGRSAPIRTLKATVRLHKDGTWVLEVHVDGTLDWEPGDEVELTLADGSRATATVASGTTRTATLEAGAVARLVLAYTGDAPVEVFVSGVRLEVR